MFVLGGTDGSVCMDYWNLLIISVSRIKNINPTVCYFIQKRKRIDFKNVCLIVNIKVSTLNKLSSAGTFF